MYHSQFPGNGNIYVNQDLSNEYSYEFTGIEICVSDRRHIVCVTLAIRLSKYIYSEPL